MDILVVDDDKEVVAAIKKLLELNGYSVKTAYDGIAALEALEEGNISLIILDVMMPRLDGLSATLKIRESNSIPIIILSAKGEESDKILGLTMGADDYVTKPFNPGELVARVKATLRRYLYLGSAQAQAQLNNPNQITVGSLCLDKGTKEVIVDGSGVKLTATEYKILHLLMSNPGIVFSAEKIYELVWNEEAYAVENTVMVHIRRIREKIEINPREPKYLKVVWGIGYKIEKA